MDFHPLALAFPPMDKEDFEHLRDQIKRYGVRFPITTYKGQVLDGRHRYLACQELGIPCPSNEWDENGSIADFVRDCNIERRQLTPSQKAAASASLLPYYQEEAAKRQAHSPDANMEDSGPAREKAAKATGASARMVQDAIRVKKESPELFSKVVSGEISVTSARLKLPPPPVKKRERDEISEAIDRADEFNEIARSIHEIKHQVQAIATQAIGRELRIQHIEAHLENAATSIRHAAPHARCECKGENEKCAACQGMGWVTKEQKARQG